MSANDPKRTSIFTAKIVQNAELDFGQVEPFPLRRPQIKVVSRSGELRRNCLNKTRRLLNSGQTNFNGALYIATKFTTRSTRSGGDRERDFLPHRLARCLFGLSLLAATLPSFAPSVSATEKVRVSLFSWPGYAWWFIAKEKKLAPEIEFEISIIENPVDSMSMLASGQMDIVSSTIEYGPIAAEKRVPIRVVALTTTCHGSDNIILAPGITSAAGVRGGRFIAAEGGLSQIYAGWWLKQNGVGIDEVKWVNVIMDSAAAAMVGGQAEAGEFWEPSVARFSRGLRDRRLPAIARSRSGPKPPCFRMACSCRTSL